jgi:diguanylate cyclase (GGDEF)-like protein/PAS domain S-box-containing protein
MSDSVGELGRVLRFPRDGERSSSGLGSRLDALTPDDIPMPLIVLDSAGIVIDANRAATELLGGEGRGLLKLGSPFVAVIGPGIREYVSWRAGNGDDHLDARVRGRGGFVSVQLVRRPLGDEGATLVWINDKSGTQIADAHGLAFDESEHGVFVAVSTSRVIAANPAFIEMIGSSEEEVIGANWQQLVLGAVPAERIRQLHEDLRTQRTWSGRIMKIDPDRGERVLELVVHMRQRLSSEASDDSDLVDTIVAYVTDVTDGNSLQRELQEQARRDELTGLMNRAGFLEVLQQHFDAAQRSGSAISLLFIDLDNFKSLNDHFGHRYGDLLLQAFAKRLRASLKASDILGRIGGDEFVVLFDPSLPPTSLDVVVNKLRSHLLTDYQLDDVSYTCTASLGSAEYPWDATTGAELLEFADHAMYQAKTSGRNRYARFDRDHHRGRMDHEEFLEAIENGIEDMHFVPYYQPIFDAETQQISGAEALVRWIDHRGEPVVRAPGEFLPLIEGGPAGIRLGQRMFDQVLVHSRSFAALAGPMPISINMSAAQIRSENVIAHVEALSGDYSAEIAQLRVELTESAFYDGDPVVKQNLLRLLDLGATLSLDDFGTGHSSMLSLRAHAFSEVKIDRRFLVAVSSGVDDDRFVFESMLDLCSRLGLQTVCEGVETEEQLAYVRSLGSDLVQGFLLARPMPKEDLRALLRSGKLDR